MTIDLSVAGDQNTMERCNRCGIVIMDGEGRYFLPDEKILCCECMENQQKKLEGQCVREKFSNNILACSLQSHEKHKDKAG